MAASDRVLLTVGVEDYYQVGSFEGLVQREKWYRFETRIARNTHKALDLLDSFGVRATFFVLGWVADAMPEVVREIAARGHEVASSGYWHRTIRQMSRTEFREDLQRSREALERAAGTRVFGHRVPHFLRPADLWALDVVAEEGYAYDSSFRPLLRDFAAQPWLHSVHRRPTGDSGGRGLWEIPPSSLQLCSLALPLAGGNWFRQLPHTLVKPLVRSWYRRHSNPFVMYFHVWELDPGQPRLNTGSLLTRIRHYRNLDKMEWVLEDYFRTFRVTGIAEYLGLESVPVSPVPRALEITVPVGDAPRVPVTVVVPCFNEEGSLEYLANTLRSVAASLRRRYDLSFVFVDDCSRDDTWTVLNRLFGSGCTLVRHDRNRGVAAAILTGLRAAETEIVCSIDCDCTYDPHELAEMIPRLADGVDLVTASPYHPEGRVLNVPPWRLSLSRGASFLYRRVLRQKLHTYTSCFRVYRRKAVAGLLLREEGFLGIAELLARLDLQGSKIAEHPATLEVRLLGQSKMKVLRSIAGHLRLLARLAALRLSGRRSGKSAQSAELRPSPSGAHHE